MTDKTAGRQGNVRLFLTQKETLASKPRMAAMGHKQKVRRKGAFTSTPTPFGERTEDSRNWLSILVRLVNVEIDSA